MRMIAKKPLVVDIKRMSHEDGPGIRGVVFFKGCPLRCVFCHNPETQDPNLEISYSSKDCIRCGRCASSCPLGAIDLADPRHIDRAKCDTCAECVKVCPGTGMRAIGVYYEPEELTEILLRDLAFYRHSGGGVTLSGGECTLFPDYLERLLKLLKAQSVHTALETSGYFDYEPFRRKVLPYLDLVYFDMKLGDTSVHERFTGRPNEKIIDNLRALLKETGVKVEPRAPLVPGVTATFENLSSIVEMLNNAGAQNVTLLPYNPMGMETAISLGRHKPPLQERFMSPEEEMKATEMFRAIINNKACRRGANT